MNLDDFDLNDNPLKIEASKQIYKNLFLYNALRETWEDEISLISLIDFSSLDRYDLLSENKYTIEMYNEFNRQTVKDFNLKIPNTIWDYFKLEVDDDPLLILWYIIFNEFILWKHSYLCYKNNYYDDFIIADESNIIKTLSYHSQTFCMSFANNYNIKLDNIESLNTVKQSTLYEDRRMIDWYFKIHTIWKTLEEKTIIFTLHPYCYWNRYDWSFTCPWLENFDIPITLKLIYCENWKVLDDIFDNC